MILAIPWVVVWGVQEGRHPYYLSTPAVSRGAGTAWMLCSESMGSPPPVGTLYIELEGRTITLGVGQGVVVPRGVRHRPYSPKPSVVLMIETTGIHPMGADS